MDGGNVALFGGSFDKIYGDIVYRDIGNSERLRLYNFNLKYYWLFLCSCF